MPQADLVALNGKLSIDSYLSVGYPREAIVECEALRYSYLHDDPVVTLSRKKKENEIKLLVLGCYVPLNTIEMLQLLEAAVPHISIPITFTAKSHPNYQIKPSNFPSLQLTVVMDSLQTLAGNPNSICGNSR